MINYIEYFGLPGSGKTTLLYNRTEKNSVYFPNGDSIDFHEHHSKILKLYLCLSGLFTKKGFLISYRIVKCIVKHKLIKKQQLDLLIGAYQLYLYMCAQVKRYDNRTFVTDMGFIQIGVSIIKRTQEINVEEFISNYTNIFFSNDYYSQFIYINTNIEKCYKRIISRGKQLSIMNGSYEQIINSLKNEKVYFDIWSKNIRKLSNNNKNINLEYLKN
jgi:hypothetical protein